VVCGLSANLLAHYKREHGLKNRIITSDKWKFENEDMNRERSALLSSLNKPATRSSILRDIPHYIHENRFLTADS